MNNPLISVIVPVYKVEKYLDKCIESIVRQTYRNLEIILVDDGSPDSCPQICDEWAKKDNRIKVIHKKNGGVSSARNAALEVASGDYIGFVDSDDTIFENYYEILLHNLVQYDADISRCAHRYIYDDGSSMDCDEIVDEYVVISGKHKIMSDIQHSGNKAVVLWNKLFKNSVISGIKFNENFVVGEDTLFLYNAYKNANRMICHDVPLYNYGIHDERSFTRKDYNYQAYRSMKEIVSDDECPVIIFRKYFIFATMTLHDIVVNDLDVSFDDIRNDISVNKLKIMKALIMSNDYKMLLKLLLLLFSSKSYKKFLNK